jgi:hypothetical protein
VIVRAFAIEFYRMRMSYFQKKKKNIEIIKTMIMVMVKNGEKNNYWDNFGFFFRIYHGITALTIG